MCVELVEGGGMPAETVSPVTRLADLESALFDDHGRTRRGIDPDEAAATVEAINGLRQALGWLLIDLEGRWRWPSLCA